MPINHQPTAKMKRRSTLVLICMLALGAAVIAQLFRESVIQNDYYQNMANERHFGSIPIPASRGSIYDCNGKILAQSATVYKIYIDPSLYQRQLQQIREREQDKVAASAKKGSVYTPIDVDKVQAELIKFLSEKLEIPEAKVQEAMLKDNQYSVLKTKVDKPVADAILKYVSKIQIDEDRSVSFSAITSETDTRRYYPQNSLAASVIGFTNSDGDGLYGLEAMYDEYLSGTDGRVISAKDVNGDEMPYRYSKTYDAQDGNSLYLTIDTTLQTYLESALEEMVETFNVANRSCGIIMNAKTGAVLSMATYPGFDLNDPYTIADPVVAANLATLSETDYTTAYVEARETQWKNKAITELYQPGSVFKVVTASAGFEENVLKLTDTFTCTGGVTVAAGTEPIHCHKRAGHGTQDFTHALINSCNPAFIEIGRRLGSNLFFQYFTAFGLTEKTGIDLPGEATSYYQGLKGMGPVELASCSFGQTNIITPVEMITAFAAVINGGYLVTPYVVSKVADGDGNVIQTKDVNVRRQVISAETSATMREALEKVVTPNGGGNAYIKGYRIGGKSGTSQKIGGNYTTEVEKNIASFACFAPADDPEIIMLIMADEPDRSKGYFGGTVVAPYARKVMEKALPYLGYYPEYTPEEQAKLDVRVPFLEDKTIEEARAELTELGLQCYTVGEGTTVYSQTPITGATMVRNGTVILYTEEMTDTEMAVVPNMQGMTLAQANAELTKQRLNYITSGASPERTDVRIQMQSSEPGMSVPKGTVIELVFGVNDQSG